MVYSQRLWRGPGARVRWRITPGARRTFLTQRAAAQKPHIWFDLAIPFAYDAIYGYI